VVHKLRHLGFDVSQAWVRVTNTIDRVKSSDQFLDGACRSPTLRLAQPPTMHSKTRFLVDLVNPPPGGGLSPEEINLDGVQQASESLVWKVVSRSLPGASVTPNGSWPGHQFPSRSSQALRAAWPCRSESAIDAPLMTTAPFRLVGASGNCPARALLSLP